MDFRILGPVEVIDGGRPVRLGGPRQRALLAYLLLHPNEAVAAERLLDEIWFEAPQGGLAALQTQISRLRRILADRIVTAGSGYAITVEPGELDLERFRSLLAEAGATEDPKARSRCLRDADVLWRGEPLVGLDVPFAAGEAAALEELRLAAVEDRIEADLDAGLDGELVSELSALVRRHPFRERLRGELILALYRSGRQADALSAYRETRRVLDEDLGLEPSPALRELEQAILRHDPLLSSPLVVRSPVESVDAREPPPDRRRRRAVVSAVLALVLAAGAVVAFEVEHLGRSPHASAAAGGPPALVPAPKRPSGAKGHPTTRPAGETVHPKTVTVRRSAKPASGVTTVRAATHAPAARTVATPATTSPSQSLARRSVPAAAHPTRPSRRTLSDDFSESAPRWTMWSVDTEGAGATWTLAGGQLELTLLASGVAGGRYDTLSEGFGSQCRFDGDFDARVHYQLLDWKAPTGARVQLSASVLSNLSSDAARTSTPAGESYSGDIAATYNLSPTNDTQGALRVTRTSGLVKTSFLDHGEWVQLNAARAVGQMTLGLQLVAPAADWQQKETRVAFDNFKVSAPTMVCP